MQVGIAILVDDDTHNAVRRLQLRVARQLKVRNLALKQTPHLTLKQPFDVKRMEPVEEYFDELVGSVEPFELRLEGIDWFPEDRAVFLGVGADERLETLRQRILADLSERLRVRPRDIEDDRYRFHLTLAYGLGADALEAARSLLKAEELRLRCHWDTLGLFTYTGEAWIVYRRRRLYSPG